MSYSLVNRYHDVPIRAQTISGQPTKYQCKVAEASVTLLYFVDGKNVGNLRVALSTETDAGSELVCQFVCSCVWFHG